MKGVWRVKQSGEGQVFELSLITLREKIFHGELSSEDEFFEAKTGKWKKLSEVEGPVDDSTVRRMIDEAERSYRRHNIPKARKLLENSLVLRCHAPALFLLGVIETQNGMNRKALDAFKGSLECAEGYKTSIICNNIGVLLVFEDEPDRAMEWFQRATQCIPKLAEPHYNLALLYQWWRKSKLRNDKDYNAFWENELRIAYTLDCSGQTDKDALLLYDESLLEEIWKT